jgi:hypothetical protein
MLTKLRVVVMALLLSAALAAPMMWTVATAAQETITPAINNGGERSGPDPIQPHPMAYGVIVAALLVGVGVGVAAVVVIRGWDRSRPIERETEEHQRPHSL